MRFVIVPAAQAGDAAAYQREIAKLCEPERTCFLNFYTNASGAPVAAVVHRVDDEACGVEGTGKAVVALAMFGKAVGDLDDAHRLARGFGPGVGGDTGAVGVGLEGGSGAHHFILAR